MSSQHIEHIDAAVLRLIDLRRSIISGIGHDGDNLDLLASIQGAFHDLLMAKQHETALETDPLGLEAFQGF